MAESARAGAWAEIPVALPEPGRTRAFELGGRGLLLCNVDGEAWVIQNRCPHAAFPLAGG